MDRVLLEDTFEFQTVPFLVRVEERDMFINAETGSARGVSMYGGPLGAEDSKEWVKCKCILAKVRPDYPYKVKDEWPENVDMHFHCVTPLEQPTKKSGLIWTTYGKTRTEKSVADVDANKLAETVV